MLISRICAKENSNFPSFPFHNLLSPLQSDEREGERPSEVRPTNKHNAQLKLVK